MKRIVIIVLILSCFLGSCRFFREKRAEHHQPFDPHKTKKAQHKPHH